MNFREELSLLLRARIPVINIVGSEEARIIRVIEALAASRDWPAGEGLYSWDIADQFVCHREANPRFDSSAQATPDTILTMIEGYKGGATFILKDFHHVWEIKKSIIRKLRNLSQKLPTASRRKNIIMITPEYKLPIELKDDVVYLECPKPDATEIDALIRRVFDDRMLHGVTAELRAKIVESALGLSSTQVERVFRMAAASGRDGRLDESCIDLISSEKCRIIRESGALEFLTTTEKEGNIGRLDVLKGWLGQRAASFMEKARAYGKKGFTMVAQKFDLSRIATATEGFVGAELEAIVKDAMFPAFIDNERELDTDDLLKSGNDMVPLAKSHAEVVTKLRALVTGGLARNASKVAVEKVASCAGTSIHGDL